MPKYLLTLLLAISFQMVSGQTEKLALVKYRGGGDWYANPSALSNLSEFCNSQIGSSLNPDYATVEMGSSEIFEYPFLHLTGHGNIIFDKQEADNLKRYLEAGGFVHIDDNYGMDEFIRPELNRIFGEGKLQLLSADHPIFKGPFNFQEGLPKIHEHDGQAPEAWGLFIDGRLALVYTYECDLSDGWEDPEVHHDPEDVRLKALQMGANLIHYAFNGSFL
ncbi:DUF4159 domain-containing protein [Croceimicrobium hydrocarbonivorans]|uniref:DUF4159 domain-containing protein n=2 Tax=Croceimicrobium hydrocarbonivorans TaxID=2761580 RepID=A0A7H0VDJ3_9FLAO|nr:DUF4159 domain-containing protein [Croceimicrobium hydrocarbonivorans]